MNVSDHAYQGNAVYLQVNLAGVDVSDDIGGVSGLVKVARIIRADRTIALGEATLTLNDADGYYSPRNDSNFFVVQRC